MSEKQAMSLCDLLQFRCSYDNGMGKVADHSIARDLKKIFPEFNWRVILARGSQWSFWILTVDDNDTRDLIPVDDDTNEPAHSYPGLRR